MVHVFLSPLFVLSHLSIKSFLRFSFKYIILFLHPFSFSFPIHPTLLASFLFHFFSVISLNSFLLFPPHFTLIPSFSHLPFLFLLIPVTHVFYLSSHLPFLPVTLPSSFLFCPHHFTLLSFLPTPFLRRLLSLSHLSSRCLRERQVDTLSSFHFVRQILVFTCLRARHHPSPLVVIIIIITYHPPSLSLPLPRRPYEASSSAESHFFLSSCSRSLSVF